MATLLKNRTLFFGDNLEILREKIPDESFDLVYLDPPFNSNRNYNILFKEGLQESEAQVQAFEDSWHWTADTERVFQELIGTRKSQTPTNANIADLMQALERIVKKNDAMAYLTMMAVRLIELHRALKSTGSLYLHCDPTASHYLKIILDVIFDKKNFRNEIIWKRSVPHNDAQKFGAQHDVIFYYQKADKPIWNRIYMPLSEDYIEKFYRHRDPDGRRYQLTSVTAPGGRGPSYKFLGVIRNWRFTEENMMKLHSEGKIIQTKPSTVPRYKRYLDEQKGIVLQDVWDDIKPVQGQSAEYLRYSTQKPEALLERIIKASSNEDDLILDPFCGCGTTVSVAERLKRQWVGIDITMLAINLIRRRLSEQFAGKYLPVSIDGIPRDLASAKALWKKDPFEFEYWVLDMVEAVPAQSKTKGNMRGADKGIDGVINFLMDVSNGTWKYGKALVQVKGGHVQRSDIATLKGDVEREKAQCGVFITLEEPTQPMRDEAVKAGAFKVHFTVKEFQKIQIITVKNLLFSRTRPDLPLPPKPYHKEAQQIEENHSTQNGIF